MASHYSDFLFGARLSAADLNSCVGHAQTACSDHHRSEQPVPRSRAARVSFSGVARDEVTANAAERPAAAAEDGEDGHDDASAHEHGEPLDSEKVAVKHRDPYLDSIEKGVTRSSPGAGGAYGLVHGGNPSQLPEAASAGEHEHVISHALKAARTALLVTGGMANKLFGLGMMGFLVFQSMKTSMAQQATKQEPAKKKPPVLVCSPKLGSGRSASSSSRGNRRGGG